MLFGLANAGSVYNRMLDVAMKEMDRNFWMSYWDDILTFSGKPWAHFGHLTQVVRTLQGQTRNALLKPLLLYLLSQSSPVAVLVLSN